MAEGSENIILAEFKIEIDQVLKGAQQLKQAMDELSEERKHIAEDEGKASMAYVQTEIELKALREEYNRHIKMATEMMQASAERAGAEDLLTLALGQQAQSINHAKELNDQLKKQRDELNVSTDEGQEKLNQINQKIQENTDFIKQNSQTTKESVSIKEDQIEKEVQIVDALNEQAQSINHAKKLNQELKQQRDDLNVTTEEGKEKLIQINQKIEQNSEFIKENSKVTEDTIKTKEEQIEKEAEITNILEEQAQSINHAKELNKQLKQERDDLNITTEEGRAKLEEINSKIDENTEFIKENSKSIQENTAAVDEQLSREEQIVAAMEMEIRTIQEARDQNSILNKLRNETNVTTAEGREELDKLNAKLDENNAFIKENVDQYTQQKINVGNYTESIKDAFNQMDIFKGGIGNITQNFTQLTIKIQEAGGANIFFANTFRAVAAGIKGATAAAWAFMATGIGAVIAAVGAALALVITYLTSTQEGINLVNSVTRPLKALWEAFIGIAQELGKVMVDAFRNPKEAIQEVYKLVKDRVIEQFRIFEKILVGIATLDFTKMREGLQDLGERATKDMEALRDAVGGVADRFGEAYERGQKVDELMRQLSASEADYILRQGELREEIKLQNMLAQDMNKTVAEREEAGKRAIALSKEANKLQVERLEIEKEILELNTKYNDTSDEERAEIARKQAEINQANATALMEQTRLQNRLNTAKKEGIANQKKAIAEASKQMKAELDLYLLQQDQKKKELSEELALQEQIHARKLQMYQREFEASGKTKNDRLALEIKNQQAENELAKKRVELAVDNAEKEFDIFKENLERQKNEHGEFTQEWLNQEVQKNNALLAEEQRLAQARLEQGVINQTEFDAAVSAAAEQARIANEEARLQREEAARIDAQETRLAEFENEMLRREAEGESLFELERERLEEENQIRQDMLDYQLSRQEISLEQYNAKKQQIELQAAKASAEIAKKEQELKLNIMEAALNGVADLIGKNTAAGKAMSIAASLINTYQGVTKALASAPPPFNFVAAGTVAAAGFKAVRDIIKTKIPGANDGGGSAPSMSTPTQGAAPAGPLPPREEVGRNRSNVERVSEPITTGIRPTGSAVGSSSAMVQNNLIDAFNQSDLPNRVADAVREGSREGTESGSSRGIREAAETRQIASENEF